MMRRHLLVAGGGGGGLGTPPAGTLIPIGSRTAIPSSGYNGFPGMTLLTDDDLFLVYRYGTAHNSSGGEADWRISTDLGVTWSSSGTAIEIASAGNDIRDPAIARQASGRLHVAYDARNPYTSTNISAITRYSDDSGATWSTRYFPPFYGGPITSLVSSQPIISGTDVIVPGAAEESGNPLFALYWKSTNNGVSYGAATVIASHATRDYQETQIRILASGRWLALMRSESNHHTWRTYSDNAGATWSTPDDVNAMTGRPDFVEYRPGKIVQFGRYNTTADSPTYYTLSSDDGATWSAPLAVDPGETMLNMYCAPVVTTTGVVKMVYCLEASAASSGLYFRTFSDA